MDIKREVKQTKILGVIFKKPLLIVSGVIFICLMIWSLLNATNTLFIDKEKVWTGVVKSGELNLEVQGYGKLKSKVQWLLTSPVKATVKEIRLKPGAQVMPDSIIMQLQNPELDQQVLNQTIELKSLQANLRQQNVNLRREYLAQQGHLAELEAKHATANLRLESVNYLAAKGIVSQLDFKSAKLEELQLRKRLKIENERLEQLTEGDQAEAIRVSFGAQTAQYIQILDGATEGDRLILSDTSLWENEPLLTYN